jgi:hypothetical protein
MYRTLSDLKLSIEQMIAEQGPNASCAAFIFTKNDVFRYDENDQEQYLNEDDTDKVLNTLGDCDYIYEQVSEVIEEEVRRAQSKV